jgi:ADP-ribose pyrophosphatase
MDDYELDKIIVNREKYVNSWDIRKIFKEELLNKDNQTIDDCVKETVRRTKELSYHRSPEYKEMVLLEKINELYKRVKGEYIRREVLYKGNFLDILKETYRLPNDKVVAKERVRKNDGKHAVVVVAWDDEKFIITFQHRINNRIIAEFPAGYIEDGESPLDAAKRELEEETGYSSNDLFILDEAYTSPGIDNSKTYIVVAANCRKKEEEYNSGIELVSYGLFTKEELDYLTSKNIMNGAMNKLAYYNIINNVESNEIHYANGVKNYVLTKKERPGLKPGK